MPGFELLSLLRQDPGLEGVPMVVFTALEKTGDREDALSRGANAFIPKPLSFTEFVQDIESLKEQWLSSGGCKSLELGTAEV